MKTNLHLILLLLYGAGFHITVTQSAKILSLFPFPGPSQYIFGSALLKRLAELGHEVTSISTFPQKQPIKNFRDVPVMDNANLYDGIMSNMADSKKTTSFFEEFINLAEVGEQAVSNVLRNPKVQSLMQNEHFDLIIVEVFVSEALLGLGEHFGVPVIGVSTFGTINFMDHLVGNPSPLSYIPHMGLPYDNAMSLWQRLHNVLMHTVDLLCFNFLMLPKQEQLYRKHFPRNRLSLNEARKNVSLVLLNNHFTLNFPRPYVTNMIEVGGLHVKEKPDPLPEDLQTFLDAATEGAIYFSMGSNVKSKDLPPEKLNIFLEAFRKMKVKVLWKFELENMPNKPDNVLIRKWYPQPSVLAHRNVKLFISHGGFLSTTETIFHGKPILGIPVLGDQFMNVKNAVKAGYAQSLQFINITAGEFEMNLREMWTNQRYYKAAQGLSKKFRDKPMTPMDTAIYWIEYVLRHQGARHMRNPGQHLNFWQYHNIDVFLIFVAIAFIAKSVLSTYVDRGEGRIDVRTTGNGRGINVKRFLYVKCFKFI